MNGFSRSSLTLFLLAGLCAGCAHSPPGDRAETGLTGLYVCAESPRSCLDLRASGEYFLRVQIGEYRRGAYSVVRGAVLVGGGSNDAALRMTSDATGLTDQFGRRWTRDPRRRGPDRSGYVPVTVRVVDEDTERPVTAFSYDYWIDTGRGADFDFAARRRDVFAQDGCFSVPAPLECELNVCVESPRYLNAFGSWATFFIEPDDARMYEVRLRPGAVVTGRVTAADGSGPVTGALVSAAILVSPEQSVDIERSVRTDSEGRFELPAVDPTLGFRVSCPPYADCVVAGLAAAGERRGPLRYEINASIGATPAAIATGCVCDEEGNRIIELAGRVKGPNGKPMSSFSVLLGAGARPEEYACRHVDVEDPGGRFVLSVPSEGLYWLGVRAEGCAFCELSVEVRRGMEEVSVELSRGAEISGRLADAVLGEQLRAVISPVVERPGGDTAFESCARRESTVGHGGVFLFGNVPEGEYSLEFMRGDAVLLRSRLHVPATNWLDLGELEIERPAGPENPDRVEEPAGVEEPSGVEEPAGVEHPAAAGECAPELPEKEPESIKGVPANGL